MATGALLERERELDTLHEGLDRALAGEGTLVVVEGPPGVGKTALAREMRAAAEQARIVALEARASELEQPFAFGVVRQLLEPVISTMAGQAELFAGAAGPASRLFEPDEQRSPGGDPGFGALHSLYWLVVNIADQAPVLMLADDCQWADGESLRFLGYLAQRIDGLPVVMVLTGRPPGAAGGGGETGALWAQLASRPAAAVLYPRPLSESAVVTLARDRLGPEAAEEFCRACHAATGGNPLYLRELLRALGAAGVVPSASAASEVQVVGPAAVTRFVLHRLAALGPAAAGLARAVAVLGEGSELPLASRMSGLSDSSARRAADDLVRADIFVPADRLGFVHPIVRAALYEDLVPGERQALHAAAADALAAAGASAERRTVHLLLTAPAGNPATIGTLRLAAASAAHRGAPRAAAERLRRALAESPPAQERAEILAELGRYEVAVMEFEAAEEHLREALTPRAAPATRAAAASTLGRCAIVSGGRSADAATVALWALAGELAPVDTERSLELGAELLMIETVVPRLRPGLAAHLQRFAGQARGHPGYEAVANIHAAWERLLRAGPAAAAVAEVEAALAAGLPPAAQTSAGLLAVLVLRLGERYDLAGRLLDVAAEHARREGHTTRQGIIHAYRAGIALAQGLLHDAEVEAEIGLQLVAAPHFAVLQLLTAAIVAQVERGAVAAAAGLAAAGEAAGLTEERVYVTEFLIARGRLRIAQGQLEHGVADLLWAGQRREAQGVLWPADWKAFAAPALALLGEGKQAARLAREQLATARQVGAAGSLGGALRAAGLAIGGEQGLALLREAVTVLQRSAARLELAHALTDLSAALNRAGRRREGRDAARGAVTLAGQCGASALAQSAMAELHAGPGRRARAELTGLGALTAAEWRVCRQTAGGHTNREVAQALFVTEKTIERHLSSAYAKLGIRSRFQLPAAIGQ